MTDSHVFFDRLVSPPSVGERDVYQQYPVAGESYTVARGSVPRDGPVLPTFAKDGFCTVGQFNKTLPDDYPRARVIIGPTTLKHIYGTSGWKGDEKGQCTTGALNDHMSFGYNYSWRPINTMGYDSSRPLSVGAIPENLPGEKKMDESIYGVSSTRSGVQRLGFYLDPDRPFRTASVMQYPANGRHTFEPRMSTSYAWHRESHAEQAGRWRKHEVPGERLLTTVHPRFDPTVPPISKARRS